VEKTPCSRTHAITTKQPTTTHLLGVVLQQLDALVAVVLGLDAVADAGHALAAALEPLDKLLRRQALVDGVLCGGGACVCVVFSGGVVVDAPLNTKTKTTTAHVTTPHTTTTAHTHKRTLKQRAASSIAPPNRGPIVSSPLTRHDTRSLPARDVTIALCAPDTHGPWSAQSITHISMNLVAYLFG
jgi:hypothetical protein